MKKKTSNIIYGAHAVLAALKNPNRICQLLFLSRGISPEIEQAMLHQSNLKVKHITPDEMDELVGDDTVHQGIALRAQPLKQPFIEDLVESCGPNACVVILDQVTDPQNVGAIMRSAAAFGASAVIQQEMNSPDATSSALIKAASGAIEEIPLINVTNLARTMDHLKKAGFWCVGLDEHGQDHLHKVNLNGRTALILGREGKGLRTLTRENCDILAKLPTEQGFSTLNVSNATAVALYEWRRQHAI